MFQGKDLGGTAVLRFKLAVIMPEAADLVNESTKTGGLKVERTEMVLFHTTNKVPVVDVSVAIAADSEGSVFDIIVCVLVLDQ